MTRTLNFEHLLTCVTMFDTLTVIFTNKIRAYSKCVFSVQTVFAISSQHYFKQKLFIQPNN